MEFGQSANETRIVMSGCGCFLAAPDSSLEDGSFRSVFSERGREVGVELGHRSHYQSLRLFVFPSMHI